MNVNEDDLDWDEDICLYQGQPFTGIMQSFHPNGVLREEFIYANGFQHGPGREWHSDGGLKREWYAARGLAEGTLCEWHENGQMKVVARYTKGVELTFDEWSDAGLLMNHREIDLWSELAKYALGSDP